MHELLACTPAAEEAEAGAGDVPKAGSAYVVEVFVADKATNRLVSTFVFLRHESPCNDAGR